MVINRIIDNASVAIASYNRKPVSSARQMALAHPRKNGANVFGLNPKIKVDCEWAAWANGTAVRELDYHDTFLAADYSHPGDNIPGILAVAQQKGCSGMDLIKGILTGYEVQVNLVKGICLHKHKIDHIAQTVNYDEMSSALLSYTTLFNCQKSPILDIIDPSGITKSQIIENKTKSFRITMNATNNNKTVAGKFLENKKGSGIQHIALSTTNIIKLVKTSAHGGFITLVSLIFAGALGNLLDNLFYGLIFDSGTTWNRVFEYWVGYNGVSTLFSGQYGGLLEGCVVDMLHFVFYWPSWTPFGLANEEVFPPVFNIADACISSSVFLIIIFYKKIISKEDLEFSFF